MALIKLKTLNRDLQIATDNKRKEIELKKNAVDKLQLNLENLLYKQSYLKRDIRTCKDIATPNLIEIEKELGTPLGTTEYTESLAVVHQKTLTALKQEKEARIATRRNLDEVTAKSKLALEQLDKKRKFVDELPAKLKLIKAATVDLETQFAAIQEDTLVIV